MGEGIIALAFSVPEAIKVANFLAQICYPDISTHWVECTG